MIITHFAQKYKQNQQERELKRISKLLKIFNMSKDYELLCRLFTQIDECPDDLALKLRYSRLQKFVLQLAVKQLLYEQERFKQLVHCSSINSHFKNRNVPVFSSENSICFSEIKYCCSTWSCPICSAYISEKRKREILSALKFFRGERFGRSSTGKRAHKNYDKLPGGEVRMLTFTVPHDISIPLSDFLARFNDAFRQMKKQRAYKNWIHRNLIVGSIHVLEVTYGDKNGWHVHAHIAYFFGNKDITNTEISGLQYKERDGNELDYSVRPEGRIDSLREHFYKDSKKRIFYGTNDSTLLNIHSDNSLFPLWAKAAQRAGFPPPSPNAFAVSNGDALADYLAKWGREPASLWDLSLELSKQHVRNKDSKYCSENGTILRASPFDLLRRYAFAHDTKAGDLFIEFSQAFKGRHNITWSRGFKEYCKLDEKSDNNLFEEVGPLTLLGSLTYEQYKRLERFKAHGTFLEKCKNEGFSKALLWLDIIYADNNSIKGGVGWSIGGIKPANFINGRFSSYEEAVLYSIEQYQKQPPNPFFVSHDSIASLSEALLEDEYISLIEKGIIQEPGFKGQDEYELPF